MPLLPTSSAIESRFITQFSYNLGIVPLDRRHVRARPVLLRLGPLELRGIRHGRRHYVVQPGFLRQSVLSLP